MQKMAKKGTFITFEGGEGCGKSTHIDRLVTRLRQDGYQVLVAREPGGTNVGEQIRHILQYSKQSAAMVPETELLLFCASRAQLVREVIEPALNEGHVVICDRFFDSTTVYQGVGRKIAPSAVAAINKFAIGKNLPDLTLVIDLDPRIGLEQGPRSRVVRPHGEPFVGVLRPRPARLPGPGPARDGSRQGDRRRPFPGSN